MSGVSGASGSGSLGKSPAGGGTFTFPPPAQPLTHKAAVYYHHQLALSDDQGIDMTQVSLLQLRWKLRQGPRDNLKPSKLRSRISWQDRSLIVLLCAH